MSDTDKSGKKTFLVSFLSLLRSRDNINIRNARFDHIQYMLIFSLAPVFANMQGALFSDSVRLFGLDAMTHFYDVSQFFGIYQFFSNLWLFQYHEYIGRLAVKKIFQGLRLRLGFCENI